MADTRGHIAVRGARTHNLKNVDVTLPPRSLIVMTGVSGSGKSSLAFDTIYAEGQRRYVESLSAYARQFLERMEKPDVDSIEGICPAIAIRQKNSIRNPRSHGRDDDRDPRLPAAALRARRAHLLPRLRQGSHPRNGGGRRRAPERTAGRHSPADRLRHAGRGLDAARRNRTGTRGRGSPGEGGEAEVAVPQLDAAGPGGLGRGNDRDAPPQGSAALRRRGFTGLWMARLNLEDVDTATLRDRASLQVIVDRIKVDPRRPRAPHRFDRDRLHGGRRCGLRGELPFRLRGEGVSSHVSPSGSSAASATFSTKCRSRGCSRSTTRSARVRSATASATSSSSTWLWSCPIRPKSLQQNAIEPWTKPHYRAQLVELKRVAKKRVRLDVPWSELDEDEKRFVIEGDGGGWEGVKGFFRWLERKKYKVHVRVFLSRYRGYLTCPECGGARLRREARDVRVGERTIDVVCGLTVKDADRFFRDADAVGEGRCGRRQGAARDPQAPRVPARRRARLPDAGSALVDALGRRVAAHQPGDVARLGARRHALRPRRAVDRPALARQRAPDRASCASCATRATPCSSSSTTPT